MTHVNAASCHSEQVRPPPNGAALHFLESHVRPGPGRKPSTCTEQGFRESRVRTACGVTMKTLTCRKQICPASSPKGLFWLLPQSRNVKKPETMMVNKPAAFRNVTDNDSRNDKPSLPLSGGWNALGPQSLKKERGQCKTCKCALSIT